MCVFNVLEIEISDFFKKIIAYFAMFKERLTRHPLTRLYFKLYVTLQ